ncbi:MAG: calcium-translocating P-type ATPase, PMCA-type [Lachnospiraceae bacterium]|nr:calcium-translocating P-type ATPase, PMCA-type [Lachnospiraceae bacterium]
MYFNEQREEIVERLQSDPARGLTAAEAAARLETYGPNKLDEGKKKSIFMLFLGQLNDPLIFILIIAAVVSGLMSEISDTIIIGLVVILNAIIGVSQEAKAEKSMEALKKLSTPKAYVIRDGETIEIDSENLVPGDIVALDAGRFIPCDMRLLESVNLQVEESALTGESVPVSKNAELLITEEDIPLGDKKNMAFSSTLVTNGRGKGIVTGTGMQTEIGKIAGMLGEKDEKTPLQKKLGEIGNLLGIIALAVCAAMFLIAVIQQRPMLEMLLTAISLAVAAIPEGMPAIVSIVLAMGVQRMVKKDAIVRKLPSVETLGAVNIICSDKTGTLTQNRMTVMKFFVDEAEVKIEDVDLSNATQKLLVEGLMLCSDATSNENGSTGDPTEVALIDAGRRHGLTGEEVGEEHARVNEAPFDSDRKLMSTVNRYDDSYYVLTKGAMDNLLKKSTHALIRGEKVVLTDEIRKSFTDASNAMSSDALRVLGFAYKEVAAYEDLDEAAMECDLTFIGLVAMIDPPRLEVRDSIATCKASGITTVMITGDHQTTAFAIAKELGIATDISQTMPGMELDQYSDEELIERVRNIRVFARVSPEHKVRIVKAFKGLGNIVSMTGDGVNDAPSLKAADIGVAMGITGTDVAKGASDLILTDDNFATIVDAVEEGRNIYANIKKSIMFLLSCNIGEIVSLFLAVLFGWPVPLQSVHLLWVNLITDTFPALSLGVDPGDPEIMKAKPRKASESLFKGRVVFLIGNGILIGFLTLAAFVVGAAMYSNIHDIGALLLHIADESTFHNDLAGLQHARTMAFVVLSVSQLFHAFNLRSEDKSIFKVGLFTNKWLVGSLFIGLLVQVCVIYVPFLASAFKVVPLNPTDWAIVLGMSIIPVICNEVAKLLFHKSK